jgi:hypothetical protein
MVGCLKSDITFLKNKATKIKKHKTFLDLKKALDQPDLLMDASHVVAKFNRDITLKNYVKTKTLAGKYNFTEGDPTDCIYKIGNAYFSYETLNIISRDARANKLITNSQPDRLLLNVEIFHDVKQDQPVILKIKKHTYFIAPRVEDGEKPDDSEFTLISDNQTSMTKKSDESKPYWGEKTEWKPVWIMPKGVIN